jgi:hypothetical protein
MAELDKEIEIFKHKKQELLNLISEYEELKVIFNTSLQKDPFEMIINCFFGLEIDTGVDGQRRFGRGVRKERQRLPERIKK